MDPIPPPQTPPPIVPVDNKKTSYKKLFFIVVVLLLIFLLAALLFYFGKQFLDNKKQPADSSVTDPDVTTPEVLTPLKGDFSGVIKEVDGTTLTVSNIVLLTDGGTTSATGQSKTIDKTYKVLVTPTTELKTESILIPYSLKPAATLTKPKTELSDLKVGRIVVVVSKDNFKELKTEQVEASSIMVSPGLTVVQGIITDITGDNLSLQTASSSATEVRDYQFVLSSETEITPSYHVTKNRPASNLPRSDLKKDGQIFVYTNVDINSSQNPPALKIDLIPSTP